MFSIQIPVLNATAGNAGDGVIRGKINKSIPVAVLMGESLVTISQVLRKDITANGAAWQDVTTAALDAAAGDFQPFGAAANMSSGDAFYIRTLNDTDTHVLYFQVATAGVGAWGLDVQEWNVTTDALESVIGLVDASNGFKAGVGVYRISYTSGAEGKFRLDDVNPKYGWHQVILTNFVSASIAPVLSRVWSADTAIKYKNITAAHTSSPADFSSLPAEELPRVGDCIMLVHPGLPMGEDVVITRAASTNYTTQREYIASDGTYKPLADVSDPSNGYSATPAATAYPIRWTIPTDWVPKTITDSSGVAHTGYIECQRITAVTTEGPVDPPQVQSRSRSFGSGNASGIYHRAAATYNAITFEADVPATSNTVIAFTNAITGQSRTVTIPSGVKSSADMANGRLDFSSALSIGAGEHLLVAFISGGTLQGLKMEVQ